VLGGTATIANPASASAPVASPDFGYWISEASKLLEAKAPNYDGALFCAGKAVEAAGSDVEWARARNADGIAQFHLGKLDVAIAAFTTIAERFSGSIDADRRYWHARALINKGIALGALLFTDEILSKLHAMEERPWSEYGKRAKPLASQQLAALLRPLGVRPGSVRRGEKTNKGYRCEDLGDSFARYLG